MGDAAILGVMPQGSLARGDGHPGSDMDLFILLRDGQHRPFAVETIDGVLVERHAKDFDGATRKLQENPIQVYGFLEGRILHDPSGRLAEIVAFARHLLDTYRTPPETLAGIIYWLRSARIKITASEYGSGLLKAAFITATTSWKILEGLWGVNDLPLPPSGSAPAHLSDLTRRPPGLDTLIASLFSGQTADRIAAAITLIDWVIGQPP